MRQYTSTASANRGQTGKGRNNDRGQHYRSRSGGCDGCWYRRQAVPDRFSTERNAKGTAITSEAVIPDITGSTTRQFLRWWMHRAMCSCGTLPRKSAMQYARCSTALRRCQQAEDENNGTNTTLDRQSSTAWDQSGHRSVAVR